MAFKMMTLLMIPLFFTSVKPLWVVFSYLVLDIDKSFMLIVVPFIFLLVFYWDSNQINIFSSRKEFFFYNFSFILIGLFFCICILCAHSFLFIIFMELILVPMLYLMFNFSKDDDKVHSTLSMVFFNVFASIPFMMFSFLFETNSFTCYFSSSFDLYLLSDFTIILFCSLILVFKLPIFLAHFWLTKAHVSAFGACSMVLAGIMLKLGSFGLMKYYPNFIFISNLFEIFSFSYILVSLLLFSLVMIRFFDIKFLIACSSVVHMGLVVPFMIYYTPLSVASSLFMMVGHGFVSYYLFFLVSILYDYSKNRSFEFNKSYSSLCFLFSIAFFFSLFFNVGLPPFSGFFCEMMFCSFFISFSSYASLFFFLFMVSFMIFNIFLACKFFFGKNNYNIFSSNSFFLLTFLMFLFSYISHVYYYY